MFRKRWLKHGQALWEYLTRPDVTIEAEDQRHQVRLLAALLLTLLAVALLMAPLWILGSPDFLVAPYIAVAIVAAFALAYRLSRTRFYYSGAVLAIQSILLLVVITILTAPGPVTARMLALKGLVVVVMMAILFLRRPITRLLIVICLSIIFSFFFEPDVFAYTYAYLVFFVVIVGLTAVTANLGERYRRELAASKEQYRSVVEGLTEGVILCDRDGHIQAANSAAEQMLGLTDGKIMDHNLFDDDWSTIKEDGTLFPREEYPIIVTLRTGKPLTNVVLGAYTPAGKLHWLSINSQPLLHKGDSQPYAAVASFVDITERKQQERAIHEAEHRYRALFEQAHDAVFIIDLHGNYIDVNQRAADLLGYTKAEFQQLTVPEISAETAESIKIHERLLAGEYIPIYERLFRKKDGTFVPVEIKVELVQGENGRPLHIQSVVRDITERNAWEQQLRLQSAALEAAANAIIITDCAGNIQWSNPAYTRLTGYTAAESQGKNPRELVKSGLHDEAFYRDLWDTVLSHQIWQGKLINRRKDGTFYTEEQTITPVKDESGQITHFIAVKQDISEREQNQEALRQSEARQRALLSAIPDLMFRNHRDGTFLDYHTGYVEQLAVPPEQFLGKKPADVLSQELAAYQMHYIEQVLQSGKQAIYEYTMVLHGQTLHFEARMVPAGPDEVLAIVRDITEQKALQAQAIALAVEKERANLLRQFVQTASHEIRTPLSIINTDLYLLTQVNDEQKRQYYVERSQQQIIRLTHLLTMIFIMTELDSDIPFTFSETDINDLLQQLVSGAKGVFSVKEGLIEFTPDSTLPMIKVDMNWLQQAIRHLLDNAIRFTPPGGWIKLRTYQQEQEAVIEISDSGPGISTQALPRIFDRFWRQDEAHSTPGFGLGLSIAQKIIERHNGRIEVESEVGQGSQFRVLLPYDANSDS